MRIFKNPYEMVREVERDLFEMGISVHPDTMQDKYVADDKDYETLELQAYGYTLVAWPEERLMEAMDYLGGNLDWARAEFLHRITPDYLNPGTAWKLTQEIWEPFIHDGKFAYTYNERYREQLPFIMDELRKRPNTRQAILTMYDRHQDMNNMGGKARIPCSMYYQFYIREGKLNSIYTMRSCDFLTHFIHDVYFGINLMTYIARELGLSVGNFTHFMGSLHAYNKDLKKRGIF